MLAATVVPLGGDALWHSCLRLFTGSCRYVITAHGPELSRGGFFLCRTGFAGTLERLLRSLSLPHTRSISIRLRRHGHSCAPQPGSPHLPRCVKSSPIRRRQRANQARLRSFQFSLRWSSRRIG